MNELSLKYHDNKHSISELVYFKTILRLKELQETLYLYNLFYI